MKLSELIDRLTEIQTDLEGNPPSDNPEDLDPEVFITDCAHRCAKNYCISGVVDGMQAWHDRDFDSRDAIQPDYVGVWLLEGNEHSEHRYTPGYVLDSDQ